jgi:hypothetical protein
MRTPPPPSGPSSTCCSTNARQISIGHEHRTVSWLRAGCTTAQHQSAPRHHHPDEAGPAGTCA